MTAAEILELTEEEAQAEADAIFDEWHRAATIHDERWTNTK